MSARHGKQSGFIIVAVLWMIAALAVLAAIYTRFALTSAVANAVHEDRLKAGGLIAAAVELTAYQITAYGAAAGGAAARPTKGAFSFRLGAAGATVDYRSEAARIDLNAAPKELIAGLFRTLGAQPEDAADYADRIIGWRTKGELAGENKEATAYRVAGIAYKPRQGPFQSASELWLVLGIPPVLKERALGFVTVYSGSSEIDAENAAPEVIASMPGMTSEKLGAEMQRRASPPDAGIARLNQAPAPPALAAGQPAKSFRLNIRLALANGRRIGAEIVILVPEDGDEPYRVLSWRDDFDGSS